MPQIVGTTKKLVYPEDHFQILCRVYFSAVCYVLTGIPVLLCIAGFRSWWKWLHS